ncbi:GNAT family N-acetyltransferase [Alkalihalobacillus pseudalcaliphilus]|uniref:GNAT family N-acetyltransferase n=1 Tax=Alkalihalobacillus pseudalcaliphilus TaxID=79884 RepID=UPI00064D7C9C|nr:GNAT family N-acetyltransferase [Alkalihalobacillus pseudalcaliphilus]KMK77547.1 acetyltransferase [Alkalihalobacillus pseudalcaliphilus]
MYKLVENKDMLDLFHQIKEVSWQGKGFEMELGKPGSDLYLIYTEDKIPGGTFEFTPYEWNTRPFIRELFDTVIMKDMKVVEIDSFSVLPEYRGKLGRKILCLLIEYAQTKGYTHAIGIADPSVFRSFQETYQIPCQQVAEEIWYKGDHVIPTLFHLKEVYHNLHDPKYDWFTKPTGLREEVLK